MQAVSIKKMHLVGEDERGKTFDFSAKKTGDFIYFTRKAGSMSGNTYHEGKNAGTRPKMFVLFQGSIELAWRAIDSDEVHIEQVSEASIITIQPLITHSIKALTDISIMECNSIKDLEEDRIRMPVV